jgi:flagellar biogenesis protein FliO
MMEGLHNGSAMGGYGWIIGLIVIVVVIWVVVKLMNQNSNRK